VSPTEPIEGGTDLDGDVLAPPWHTGALMVVMVAVAVTGTLLSSRGVPTARSTVEISSRFVAVYLPMLLVQWSLLVYVCRVGRSRNALLLLLGQRWTSTRRAFSDIALALLGWVLIEGAELLFLRLFGIDRNSGVLRLLPTSDYERFAWILVSVSVGFCEEIVYRGYLQTQLKAFTRSPVLGVMLQALLFGMAHAEQGLAAATRLALYGFALGGLAAWRGSLLPGIICHVGIDLASGFVGGR
jgi:membrane protease YdiL (CAAX protease family)